MRKYKLHFTVFIVLMISGNVDGQNMSSPYSIYGIGDIDFRPYNRTSGMGGTGLALRSSYYILDNNPASLTGLTRSFYIVDVATTGKTVSYKGDAINADNSSSKDFWIKRISLTAKLNDHWASGIGFTQFSNVNYKFFGTKSVEGSSAVYNASYEGDGGLNEYYWNNAYQFGKRLSIGLRSSIIAGPINQIETVADEAVATAVTTKVQDYVGKPRLQAGLIYVVPVNKHWKFSVGGKYAPKLSMNADRTVTVVEGATTISEETSRVNDRFELPQTYGVGISLKHKERTTFAIDYVHEDWSKLQIKERGWQLINSNRVSVGAEFSKLATRWNQTIEQRYFQVGAYFNNSYLQVRNQPIREFGISVGGGGYLGPTLIYSAALEAGRRGTTSQKLIRENFVQMTFTFSYRDFVRSKGRRYD